VAKKATISRTPSDVALALGEAEREIKQPPSGKRETIQIRPALIATRLELFQPRGFRKGELDAGHVKKLARRIATKGELEPPLVVKLGRKWVCVDGHHRIAAYTKQNGFDWTGTITCIWLAGSVQDAVNESLRLNEIIKLEMSRGDRYEAAWQRVVLGWGSKSDIRNLTGVSDGLIAMMRRVVKAHKRNDAFGKAFKKRLLRIKDATWTNARNAYLDLEPSEWDYREDARKLARVLRSRMHGKLSENKLVTALALAMYDPDLPGPLATALRQVKAGMSAEDAGELRGDLREDVLVQEPIEDLLADMGRLRASQQQTQGRISGIEAELKRRDVDLAAGPQETRSDDVWAGWVGKASADLPSDDGP